MTAVSLQDPEMLWWILALAAMLILPAALYLLTSARRDRAARHLSRMRGLGPSKASGGALPVLLTPVRKGDGRLQLPWLGDPDLLAAHSGLTLSGTGLLVLLATGTLTIFAVGTVLAGPLVGLPAGLGLGLFAPVAALRAKHARRQLAFALQLPDALDLMMRGLRVGHPISATISNVGRTMPDPIGAEFRTLASQISHGDYLVDGFQDLADRMRQEDMDYLAVSIAIQHGTGGNLADMLATLSKVIRARIMLRRRVRALSSEGRISAMLLSSLPLAIYGATSFMAPDYYGAVQDHPMFMPIALIIVALVTANFLTLRHLVNFQA